MTARRPAEELHPGAPRALPPSLREVCVHEAAHAVIGMVQDPPLYIDGMGVDLGGTDKLGWVAGSPRVDSAIFEIPTIGMSAADMRAKLREPAFADAVDTLAGPVAEELWRRRSIRDVLRIGEDLRDDFDTFGSCIGHEACPNGYVDIAQTERLLISAFESDAPEVFGQAWSRALWLVVEHRHVIRRLASALAVRCRLDDDEVTAIVRHPATKAALL